MSRYQNEAFTLVDIRLTPRARLCRLSGRPVDKDSKTPP